MAAQSFKEWFDIVTDVGELDPFSGFTSKGVAHIAWDAAIKSLEGVPEQANNSTKPETISPCHRGTLLHQLTRKGMQNTGGAVSTL
jgi:hypothetical protein